MKKATILFIRDYQEKQTLSDVYIFLNGKQVFQCKGLELPYKDNKKNESCILEGIYDAIIVTRPSGKSAIYLKNVFDRNSILIHTGNTVNDILGCLLVGDSYYDINKDNLIDVVNSTITLDKILNLIKDAEFKVIVTS